MAHKKSTNGIKWIKYLKSRTILYIISFLKKRYESKLEDSRKYGIKRGIITGLLYALVAILTNCGNNKALYSKRFKSKFYFF